MPHNPTTPKSLPYHFGIELPAYSGGVNVSPRAAGRAGLSRPGVSTTGARSEYFHHGSSHLSTASRGLSVDTSVLGAWVTSCGQGCPALTEAEECPGPDPQSQDAPHCHNRQVWPCVLVAPLPLQDHCAHVLSCQRPHPAVESVYRAGAGHQGWHAVELGAPPRGRGRGHRLVS